MLCYNFQKEFEHFLYLNVPNCFILFQYIEKSLFSYTTFLCGQIILNSLNLLCKSEKFYRSVGSRALQIKYFTLTLQMLMIAFIE